MTTYQQIKASEAVVGDKVTFVPEGFLRQVSEIVDHDDRRDFHFVNGRVNPDVPATDDIWKGVEE